MAGAATARGVRSVFEAHGRPIDQLEAERTAQLQNRIQVTAAESSFRHLQTRVTEWAAEQAKQGLLDEGSPGALPYSWAERHTVYPGDNLAIDVTLLHGMEQLGEIAQFDLHTNDGPVQNTLTMTTTGDRFTGAQTLLEPQPDGELRHWLDLLAPTVGDVRTALIGNFGDETTLDAILSSVRQHFAGTPGENDLAPALEGVRAGASAAREAALFRQEFEPTPSLPSTEMLDGWVERLRTA